MKLLISEMNSTEAYRHDYENITSALLFKPVDYNTAVQVLEEVLKENIF